jgi:hypothetical protein
MRWLYVLCLLLSVSLSGCDRDAAVATVGQFTITRQDVAWRDAVHRLYFPREERKVGLDELVHACTAAQILISNGYPIMSRILTSYRALPLRRTLTSHGSKHKVSECPS